MLAPLRFLAKRGQSKLIISNNFKTLKSVRVKDFLRNNNIKWKFILERSPWLGGFYGGLIGITKSCLKKVMAKALLTFAKLSTVIYEIECSLNSRPLTYVDEDPNNNVLTPNHLIYGRNINEKCFANNELLNLKKDGVHNTFQHAKLVLDNYFKRFEHEYTLSLQERHYYITQSYAKTGDELIGDIVLVKENNVPQMN